MKTQGKTRSIKTRRHLVLCFGYSLVFACAGIVEANKQSVCIRQCFSFVLVKKKIDKWDKSLP